MAGCEGEKYSAVIPQASGVFSAMLYSNMPFTPSTRITFRNTGTNARYAIWLAATPTGDMPANALVVNAGTYH